ncbi:MAG: SAM-dependent methyltransferase [Beijerinckiaceae bacterium]
MNKSLAALVALSERYPWPDAIARLAIRGLVARTHHALAHDFSDTNSHFAQEMANYPVAMHTEEANAQHYEVPDAFFDLALGPNRKYSCCFFENDQMPLASAEENALVRTCTNAALQDGHNILELGCGWGALTLFMAKAFPNAHITAVSNSNSQRLTIQKLAASCGLENIHVVTADMNDFMSERRFDRIVSVEMFEHMSNWRALLSRCHQWLTPEGRLFIHIFTHISQSYRFDHNDKSDWIAQHFFTGGIMPAHSLLDNFQDVFKSEFDERWSGVHYALTARSWLKNFDTNVDRIYEILRPVYGKDTRLWMRRWRLFFLATEGLFGYRDGSIWGVGHYRLKPT